jgi:hypothetical protein
MGPQAGVPDRIKRKLSINDNFLLTAQDLGLSNIDNETFPLPMNKFTNLPGNLRALFGFLRVMTVIVAAFWILVLSYNTWIQDRSGHEARLLCSVGEISLPAAPGSVGLSSDTATPASLKLHSLRGSLQVDLCSNDPELVSALRRSVIPTMTVSILFAYVLFTSLRNLCANLERGDVFNLENLRLVRRIGISLVAYSLIGAGLEIWASHVLGGYFGQHVVLTGLKTSVPFPTGASALQFFNLSAGLFTAPGGLLVGSLVLVVAEAFRQGLNLKAENDLTI